MNVSMISPIQIATFTSNNSTSYTDTSFPISFFATFLFNKYSTSSFKID